MFNTTKRNSLTVNTIFCFIFQSEFFFYSPFFSSFVNDPMRRERNNAICAHGNRLPQLVFSSSFWFFVSLYSIYIYIHSFVPFLLLDIWLSHVLATFQKRTTFFFFFFGEATRVPLSHCRGRKKKASLAALL